MIIFFKEDGEVKAIEDNVMTPSLPADCETVEEQVLHYQAQGLDFVALPYELGAKAFEYKVLLTEDKRFIGLSPIKKEVV